MKPNHSLNTAIFLHYRFGPNLSYNGAESTNGPVVTESMFLLEDKAEKVAEHLHVTEILIYIITQFSISMATIREDFSPQRNFLSQYYWKAAIGTVLVICCPEHREFKDR